MEDSLTGMSLVIRCEHGSGTKKKCHKESYSNKCVEVNLFE